MTAARAKILVADDKENMRALLRDILAPRFDVGLAADGTAALAMLDADSYQIVLTDVRMPALDGFELVRVVKERWPLTEVIMMTAYASVPAAVEAIRLGAYDYVQKPFDPDDVVLVVTRALDRHAERVSASNTVPTAPLASEPELAALSYRGALACARDHGSRDYLSALLKAFGGNVSRAAERAGLERESLHRLLRRHRIHAGTFREPGQGGSG